MGVANSEFRSRCGAVSGMPPRRFAARTVGLPDALRFKVKITGENKYDPAVAHERKRRFWRDAEWSRLFLVHGTVTFCSCFVGLRSRS
jgi:hypothetical protein